MKSLLPPPTIENVICQIVYVDRDDAIAEKLRGPQEIISLSFPYHLQMAQDLFGSAVGAGFRCQWTCQIGRNNSVDETINDLSRYI